MKASQAIPALQGPQSPHPRPLSCCRTGFRNAKTERLVQHQQARRIGALCYWTEALMQVFRNAGKFLHVHACALLQVDLDTRQKRFVDIRSSGRSCRGCAAGHRSARCRKPCICPIRAVPLLPLSASSNAYHAREGSSGVLWLRSKQDRRDPSSPGSKRGIRASIFVTHLVTSGGRCSGMMQSRAAHLLHHTGCLVQMKGAFTPQVCQHSQEGRE